MEKKRQFSLEKPTDELMCYASSRTLREESSTFAAYVHANKKIHSSNENLLHRYKWDWLIN